MPDWQTIIALTIVALTAFWLTRRAVHRIASGLRGTGSAHDCGSCSKNRPVHPDRPSTKTTSLVMLGDKTKDR